eukprot:10647365-Lingulodinium_polyedra.AAC.1
MQSRVKTQALFNQLPAPVELFAGSRRVSLAFAKHGIPAQCWGIIVGLGNDFMARKNRAR